MYTCAANSTREQFTLKSYRYFGAAEGDAVYIHCDLRVCLADSNHSISRCECPDSAVCGKDALRRRSIADSIDESQVYHVVSGPFVFEEEEKELVKEEGIVFNI